MVAVGGPSPAPGPGPGVEGGALAQLCGPCLSGHASFRGEGPAGFSPSTQMWASVAPNMAFAVSVEEVWGKCPLGLGSRLAACPRDGCHRPTLVQPPRRQGRGRPSSGRAACLQPPGVVSEVHGGLRGNPSQGHMQNSSCERRGAWGSQSGVWEGPSPQPKRPHPASSPSAAAPSGSCRD